MDFIRSFRAPALKELVQASKSLLIPHYIINILLATCFFVVKTLSPICDYLFEDCFLELQQWEWLTFLGCVIVLKNRKQVSAAEYVSMACMFAKVLNIVLFYQLSVPYAFIYCVVCLLHFVFIPQPVYQGPEFVTYFRGPHLKNEIASDKRITWMICFYAAWSPSCVTVAPMFSEISAEYHLDNLKFGKLDVSRYSEVAEEYKVNTSSFSKQLPTIVLFQDGKEKMRRPAVSPKGTVVKYVYTKKNLINDFELNEVYNQCKKSLPKQSKKKSEEKKEQ